MRAIDADELLYNTDGLEHVKWSQEYGHVVLVCDIVYAPTLDVVEVVRCKDCTHCDCSIDGMGFFHCDFDEGRTVSPNGFCDVAERRKEAEDGIET